MKFEDDKKLEFKIFDLENDGNSNSHFVERQEGHYMFLNYLEPIYGLSTMAMPAISFRLADDKYNLSGICLEFFDK